MARAVAVVLATAVAVAAERSVVVAETMTVPRLVAVDLYVSGGMLGLKESLDLMLSSSPFVVGGLILLNDRKERK